MILGFLYSLTGTDDFGGLWAHVKGHDAHPLIQFVKYGLVGGVATVVFAGVFALSNVFLFPADGSLPNEVRKWNYFYSNGVGFLVSNAFCYVLNVLWVFKPGRHGRLKEFSLFLGASLFAFFIGTPLGSFLIGRYGVHEFLALGVTILASVLVNYAARKFVVFEG